MSCKILFFDLQMPYLLGNISQPVGGAAVEWVTWLKSFNQIGCNAGLLTWKGAKKLIQTPVNFDIVESYKLDAGLPKIRFFTYQLPVLIWTVFRYNPDYLVQECANRFTGILAFIAILLRKKFIHRIASDMDVDGRIEKNITGFYLKLYYFGVRHAHLISCQNNYQFKILTKKYPNKKIFLHYNPFEIKSNEELKINKNYIAWVGNFRYEKNLPALYKIAESLKKINFKIVGQQLEYNDIETNNAIEKLKDLKNVEFVGYLNNEAIPKFLSLSYCLLNTSRLEGFSNTFLEAWSVGIPVITTKNVNPDNIISQNNLGIVVENYSNLPEVLNNFIESKNYQEYESICKNYVSSYHNPQTLAQNFLSDLKSIK